MNKSQPNSRSWRTDDALALCRELEIDEHAREASKQGLPASDATEPDPTEQALRSRFESIRNDLHSNAQDTHDSLMAEQVELTARIEGTRIEDSPQAVAENLLMHENETRDRLAELNETEAKLRRQRLALEHAAGEKVSANDASSQTLLILTLLILIFVESAANGLVLGDYDSGGLRGGLIRAFAISFLSVGLSWTIGDAMRRLFDGPIFAKAFAVVGTAVFGVALLAFHTVVAWLRMVLQHADKLSIERGGEVYHLSSRPHEAFEWAIPFAMKYGINPAHLDDVHAWFLLIVGCFFGIGAFAAGWSNKTARRLAAQASIFKRHESARQDVKDEEAAYLDGLNTACHDGLEEVERREQEALQAVSAQREVCIQARRNEAEHDKQVASVVAAAAIATEQFRSTCILLRVTPVPPYFLEPAMPLADDGFRLDMSGVEIAERRLGNTLDAVRNIEDKAQAARSAIHRQLEDGLAKAPAYFAGFRTSREVGQAESGSSTNAATLVALPGLKPSA